MGVYVSVWNPRYWLGFFRSYVETMQAFIHLLEANELVKFPPEVEIWYGPPLESLDGEFLGRISKYGMMRNFWSFINRFEHIVPHNAPNYGKQQNDIIKNLCFKIDGHFHASLESEPQVPCVLRAGGPYRSTLGDIEFDIFPYMGLTFWDFFWQEPEGVKPTWKQLRQVLRALQKERHIQKIDVGRSIEAKDNFFCATHLYRRKTEVYYWEFLNLPKQLLSIENIPRYFSREGLSKTQTQLLPFKKEYLIDLVEQTHDFQTKLEDYFEQCAVEMEAGSIVLTTKDGRPLKKVFLGILKQLIRILDSGLPDKEKVSHDFVEALKEIDFQQRKR